jgi:MFS family permease
MLRNEALSGTGHPHYDARSPMTRTERTYYVVSAGYNFGGWFMAPVYPLFLLSVGLDLFQMNTVLGVFLLANFLFEVPTGAVADYFGRKASFLASCFVRMIAFALYAFADSFTDCLIAEVIDAFGNTLASGALDAWAVDGVRAEGDRRPLERMFSRVQVIMRAMMVVGGIIGGYIATIDFAYPWLVAAGIFAVTGLIGAFSMYDDRPSADARTGARHRSLTSTLAAGLQQVRGSVVLMLICVLSMIVFGAGVPAHMLWQPRVQELTGQGVWLMGWLWALVNICSLIGSASVPRLLLRVRREHLLCVINVFRTVMLIVAASSVQTVPTVIAVLLVELCFGISDPVIRSWTNEHTSTAQRATVLSAVSMFGTLGGAVGLMTLGLVARGYGIPAAWWCSAVVFAMVAPGFLLLGRVARRTPAPAIAVVPRVAAGG